MAEFIDILRLFKSLSDEEKSALEKMKEHLSQDEAKAVKRLLKQKKISLSPYTVSIAGKSHSLVNAEAEDDEIKQFVGNTNKKLEKSIEKSLFEEFSQNAVSKIKGLIAPNIVGFDHVKKAALLQLFAMDHIHILLLGDPGTGKTEIIRSASELYPVSSFGLGSGTSSTGLAVSIVGQEVTKGLLPMADGGLACIDELNLMKKEDMASLYNAMEKGFISYDKGKHHYKFNARVSVLATANPRGDRFSGIFVNDLKKQLPFDSALLTRFHLVFLVRKPDAEKFRQIAKSIVGGKKQKTSEEDIKFVQNYIREAEKIDVKIPSKLEQQIVDFAAELKQNEKAYLIEVSPRIIIGFVRLAKAAARIELRDAVEQRDINLVKDIVRESLKLG